MSTENWWNNEIQFARLLAEIHAVGLTDRQVRELCASMDLTPGQIEELFRRADRAWESIKGI